MNHYVPGTTPSHPSYISRTIHLTCHKRIRGAIDARIAEEQARHREAASAASRPARRPSTRTNPRQRSNSNLPQTRGPDPNEFEFSIGDDDSTGTPASGLSRAGTPRLEAGSTAGDSAQNEGAEQTEAGEKKETVEEGGKDNTEKPPELPIEVRSKLRRLDKIEARYHGTTPMPATAHYMLT